MAAQSNIYAGVAGYVGRPNEKGSVGVFRRAVAGGEWQHVLTHLETHTVFVHPTAHNPKVQNVRIDRNRVRMRLLLFRCGDDFRGQFGFMPFNGLHELLRADP